MGKRTQMCRKRVIFASCIIICLFLMLKLLFNSPLDPSEESFTDVKFCPACFGNTLCPQFYHGDIKLVGASRLKSYKLLNRKNVFSGRFMGHRVILKKLAHDWEIAESDRKLCQLAKLTESCEVKEAVKLLVKTPVFGRSQNNLVTILKRFNSSTDISRCPSERLLTYIFNKLNTDQIDYATSEYTHTYKLGEMMYSLLINPEAVLLQAFSQSEGWPFPHYYGSCGRIIVEEYVGLSLAYYENSPWEQRMDIAYQLLQISQMMTENTLDFALYMTDLNLDNFAVRSDGTVLLIDVENIVVVDRVKVRKEKKFMEAFHRSKGEFCKDCLNFSFEDLCYHDLSDHNYYAVCKGLLVPHAYYSTKGLLHGIPSHVEAQTNLSALLKECADPSSDVGRFYIVPKILQVLKSLL